MKFTLVRLNNPEHVTGIFAAYILDVKESPTSHLYPDQLAPVWPTFETDEPKLPRLMKARDDRRYPRYTFRVKHQYGTSQEEQIAESLMDYYDIDSVQITSLTGYRAFFNTYTRS